MLRLLLDCDLDADAVGGALVQVGQGSSSKRLNTSHSMFVQAAARGHEALVLELAARRHFQGAALRR